jgi:hypothetical protein
MSKTSFFKRLGNTVTVLEGAREAAAAVNAHRKPSRATLTKLGIDADAFDSVQFFGMTR